MITFTTYLVDDLPADLELMSLLISRYCHNIRIVGKATTLEVALEEIPQMTPHILLLDIKIKDEESFRLLDVLDTQNICVIFVSSYFEYAVKAYNYNVIDYITKPIEVSRLLKAISKATEKITYQLMLSNRHQAIPQEQPKSNDKVNFLAVATLKAIEFVQLSNIMYCEADGRYTQFVLEDGKSIIASRNLGEYEKLLPTAFYRIHHKYIVNLNVVINVNKSSGNYCEMITGQSLPIAKRKLEQLYKFLKLR